MSINATKNTNSSVAFFQLNGRKIKCFCNQTHPTNIEPYKVVEIPVISFEQWLDEHGYLEVKEEVYSSADDKNTLQKSVQWSYTIDEFLYSSTHSYNINELLSRYINEIFYQNNK